MFLSRSQRKPAGVGRPARAGAPAAASEHPHRRPLGSARSRRPGRVAPRPQPCLTPLAPRR